MTNTFPDSVPAEFSKHDDLDGAYRAGWHHGHGIACHNVPTVGRSYYTDMDGDIIADAENVRDLHATMCHWAADNSRQFSPFEFLAHEYNQHPVEPIEGDDTPTSEEMWAAFEQGTADAIAADLEGYDDEDYGIEQEEETKTLAGFVADYRITMTAERTDRNPNMEDSDMDHWLCTLRHRDLWAMTVHYSMGYGHKGKAPTAEEVLGCLADDAAGIENSNGFEDWANELGFDSDSRKAQRTYEACERQATELRDFLYAIGNDDEPYMELLFQVERN